ncbi:hypothetical protein Godav_005953 [Gossypium davidsonii]|uniref:DUF4283 domain-containing protein n=1 Tax=Gossypium davidsonii TaxID=34287 RepID=A0A7J8S3P1_GOSDV|nr:hypothetical protein [Gossypium davidsonii]
MEDDMANLRLLDDDEENAFHKNAQIVDLDLEFSLVGTCLTDSVVYFLSVRNKLANLRHPVGGICITDLGEKRYMFKFFHVIDMNRVLEGLPLFFNNHLLLLHKLDKNEDPLTLSLHSAIFWIQVHDLPLGFMSKTMARHFGDFLRDFMEYDTRLPSLGIYGYMRIRVILDVRVALK